MQIHAYSGPEFFFSQKDGIKNAPLDAANIWGAFHIR
jgi:hypothetical protein